ncbi:MAG: HAD-IC family P-type ATPase, partial [Thermoplasmata archaeon]
MREEDTKNNKKEFSTKSEDIGTTDAPKQTWHDKEKDEVIKYFKVEPQKGLETEEAKKRLLKDGPNEIVEAKKETPLMLLINQFKNFMVILLLVSTVISFVIGEVCDGIAILAIVIFAALLGFIQEYRAGNAIASLRKMAAPKATVIRNGIEEKIPAREVVAGDIIVLRAGDKVPADGRLIETVNLKVEEAALTGESVPIVKTCGKLEKNIALGDMKNLVFMGTTVAYGKGKAVVYATGMKTEFGKIAKMIEEVEEIETPLQVALDKVGKKVAYISIIIAIILMILGLIRGSGSLMNRIFEMFIWGVSIIVAIVPEALPAVVTISLGVGVQRMVKRHALVRKLHAVETLGATDYICSDKTGTLTQDRMVAEVIYLDDSLMKVSGKGYEPKGDIVKEKDGLPPAKTQTLERFMEVCALCNDSNLIEDEGSWKITGDPTEAALIVLAKKAGFDKKKLLEKYPETGEVPFTPERKRMTTVHLITGLDKSSTDKEGRKGKSGDNTGRGLAFMKGGAEIVLERCESIMLDNKIQPLLPEERKRLLEVAQKLASKAL